MGVGSDDPEADDDRDPTSSVGGDPELELEFKLDF